MTSANTLTIDNVTVPIGDERNLLELIRKAHVELPTFCYHSELSIYGACRLCMVDVEGRGLAASCSTPPEPGMKIKTQTQSVRELRRMNMELLLASGNHDCPTCTKSGSCKLQSLAERLGVNEVRFKAPRVERPLDTSSPSLVRNPNRCILCGDCVRACSEIQGVGALDFLYRGANIVVGPAFNKGLADVDCVDCGKCASVCPTGAITVKSDIDKVYAALENPAKKVVIQVAPAVRVALGDALGLPANVHVMGRLVAALRRIGFDRVYDTAFAADITILEEANEFVKRKKKGENLPLFTSCCPAWVKLAEQDFPELLPHVATRPEKFKSWVEHISSCKSPQQMFGSLAKTALPRELGVTRQDLVVVSLMPCTAKKFEAKRPEFSVNGNPDVDIVITTQEMVRMIKDAGLNMAELPPESLDMPFGFKTGAGLIFGNSGGVTEAVLRHLAAGIESSEVGKDVLSSVRSTEDRREFTLQHPELGEVKGAVVNGLAAARQLVEDLLEGYATYDFVEVMACPGGCVCGAGQPVVEEAGVRTKRTEALRQLDTALDLHASGENHMAWQAYERYLGGGPDSHEAHALLHTKYKSRKRIQSDDLALSEVTGEPKIPVRVCLGTGCQLRGAQDLLRHLLDWSDTEEVAERFDIRATFCMETCDKGPTVHVGESILCQATFDKVTLLMDDVIHEIDHAEVPTAE